MRAELTERDLELLGAPNFAHLATVADDCRPQSTAVWVEVREGFILVNSAEGRLKVRNARRHPQVALSLTPLGSGYPMLSIQGEVEEITEDGAREQLNRLSLLYDGKEFDLDPGQRRVILKIRPQRIYRYEY